VSLLIFEGQTVIEVARQAGHSPETCLRNYARVFADYDPGARIPAVEQIWAARLSVAAAARRADARDRAGRTRDVAERLEDVATISFAGLFVRVGVPRGHQKCRVGDPVSPRRRLPLAPRGSMLRSQLDSANAVINVRPTS